jgi:hypothetical protein
MNEENPISIKSAFVTLAAILAGLFVVFLVFMVMYVAYKPIHRYQLRADASNKVKVTDRLVRVRQAQINVERAEAKVQEQIGRGQKLQNEQIAKKLTPLFVQYAMVKALEQIATSGKNNSLVFIPVGANGIPLVSNTNVPQVFGADTSKK